MKALLFGASSICGYNLAINYPDLIPFIPPNKSPQNNWQQLELESTSWIRSIIAKYQPSHIIYCHAVCDVEQCETNPAWAQEINVAHIERMLNELPQSVRFIYMSSDHVFGADGSYTEDSLPCPISVYGKSRVAAETRVQENRNSLVIRFGLPIGPSINGRSGHLDWLKYRASQQLPMTIIEDESRSAVYTNALCRLIMDYAESEICGIRHIAAPAINRVDLAKYLQKSYNLKCAFKYETRAMQKCPHLGKIELMTLYSDALSNPFPTIFEAEK
ncbi:MAG: sugar nucleotide-binding protein [Lentisphaeria bacterium]|nr:sugar nucleotide-binding protein [Lentisphaeria bacterium]NQZ68531.1 sugar nucleotide-binding protein [Lentisphaeria bacterium]